MNTDSRPHCAKKGSFIQVPEASRIQDWKRWRSCSKPFEKNGSCVGAGRKTPPNSEAGGRQFSTKRQRNGPASCRNEEVHDASDGFRRRLHQCSNRTGVRLPCLGRSIRKQSEAALLSCGAHCTNLFRNIFRYQMYRLLFNLLSLSSRQLAFPTSTSEDNI